MVYVIQKTTGSTEDIDKMQAKFRQQIYQGCLVLPPNYSLVKVVEQMSANDCTKLIATDCFKEETENGDQNYKRRHRADL